MLKQCLKYDFKSVMRLWWIIAVIMAGASVVAGLGLRFFSQTVSTNDPNTAMLILSIFAMFSSMLCLFAMVAGITVSFILIFWRMYTHFYTDEGYLTFTLPVKRSTLYLSKVIMGTVLEVATILILIFGIAFLMLVVPPTESGGIFNTVAFEGLFESISGLVQSAGWWLVLWVPIVLAILVLGVLWGNGLIYLCITIGAVVAKKHKLIAAIGIYYLVNSIVSFVGQILYLFFYAGIIGVFTTAATAGGAIMNLSITAVLLIAALLLACMAAVVHFITVNKIEKKLNLA